MPYVDLHAHTNLSDGSTPPAEVARAARDAGIGTLAIADHDLIGGYLEALPECERLGIRLIPAVEIDALDGETLIHTLAYGFDAGDAEFLAFLSHVRFMLDEMSARLVERMSADYAGISLGDYMDFEHDYKGGWKALAYFLARGATRTRREGAALYPRYGVSYGASGFPSVRSAALRVKRAGGVAILAHPGVALPYESPEAFRASLDRLASMGLDGIECHYPEHGAEVTAQCLGACAEGGLIIAGGSDFHGSFGEAGLGEPRISEGDVSPIERLYSRRGEGGWKR